MSAAQSTQPVREHLVHGASVAPMSTGHERTARFPHLPGCTEGDHLDDCPQECRAVNDIGELRPPQFGEALFVRAYSYTDGAVRCAEIGIRGDDPTTERFIDPSHARAFAAVLLRAADVAELVAAGHDPSEARQRALADIAAFDQPRPQPVALLTRDSVSDLARSLGYPMTTPDQEDPNGGDAA
ncbi:MAG: hypothetical protein ABIQ18_47705 [Umezawaea sp.]